MKLQRGIRVLLILFPVALIGLLGGTFRYFSRPVDLPDSSPRRPLEQIAKFFLPTAEAHGEIETQLEVGEGVPSRTLLGSWSGFRGDNRDGIAPDSQKSDGQKSDGQKIDITQAKEIWRIPVGDGYAAPAVRGGCLYLIDHDAEHHRDIVRSLSADDGRDIWRFSYPVTMTSDHGYTRTIPAVSDRYCAGLGPLGHAWCLDATTGEKKWFVDLKEKYGTKIPNWYAGQCVLLDQNAAGEEIVLLAPAGADALVVALDAETGEEKWRTSNPYGWTMTHTSIMKMDFDGIATYVYCGSGGVFGIDAVSGKILWGSSAWKIVQATCPSPLVLPNNRLFLCGGYGAGSMILSLEKRFDGKILTKIEKRLKESGFGSTQQTPILFESHIYGVGRASGQLTCLDTEGEILWRGKSRTKIGDGPYIIADGKILALSDDGVLSATPAVSTAWEKPVEVEAIDGSECWGPPPLVNGRLYLRSIRELLCLDIRGESDVE